MTVPMLRCEFCEAILELRDSVVIDCGCVEAERARIIQREQAKQRRTKRLTFDEARQRNKRPIRKVDDVS